MATLWEILNRPDPLAGLYVLAVCDYHLRPLDGVALRAALPAPPVGAVTGGQVVIVMPECQWADAIIRADVLPLAGRADPGAGVQVLGLALADADRVYMTQNLPGPVAWASSAPMKVEWHVGYRGQGADHA